MRSEGVDGVSDDDLKWFCAECLFDGPEDDVKEHAVQFGHWYAMPSVSAITVT